MANFQKAYDLSANVSEREKLYIVGHYNMNVTGDMPKVIETLELATRTYPQSLDYWINLGVAYTVIGDIQKATSAFRQSLELQPDDSIAQENLLSVLLAQDEMAEAGERAKSDLKSGSENSLQYRQLLVAYYFLAGDPVALQEQVDYAAGKQEEYLVTQNLAVIREFSGRYQDAEVFYRKAVDQVQPQKLPDVEASLLLLEAQGQAIAGMCKDVPGLVKQALSLDKSTATIRNSGLPAALCGDSRQAMSLLDDAGKKHPQDTLINTLYLPQMRAADQLAHHHPDQALRELDAMGSYPTISQQEYLRGLAYLDLHNGGASAEAFRKALTFRGAPLINLLQDYPQAQLGLARALAMQGDKAGAKKAYQDFFTTWKNADSTLPQLVEAKSEFAALQ